MNDTNARMSEMMKIRSIQFQQVPYQGNDRKPLLLTNCTDPRSPPSVIPHFRDSSCLRICRISFFRVGSSFVALSQRIVSLIPK